VGTILGYHGPVSTSPCQTALLLIFKGQATVAQGAAVRDFPASCAFPTH
jgi:hypothetical protein